MYVYISLYVKYMPKNKANLPRYVQMKKNNLVWNALRFTESHMDFILLSLNVLLGGVEELNKL